MCETGSEWEKSPRGKIIQIFFSIISDFFFAWKKNISEKIIVLLISEGFWSSVCRDAASEIWSPVIDPQVALRDRVGQTAQADRRLHQLLSSTAWFSWDSRNFKVQHPKWEWKAPREELPAWRGVVVWWVWSQRSVSWTRTSPGSNPHPQILHLYTLSYSVTDICRLFLGGFDSDFFFLWDQKRSKKTF